MKLSEKFAIGAMATVLFKILSAGVCIKWNGDSVTLGSIDAGTVAALLTPVLGAVHLGTWVESTRWETDHDGKG
jgi:hypothetical protein